jgi:hypothetical protein
MPTAATQARIAPTKVKQPIRGLTNINGAKFEFCYY